MAWMPPFLVYDIEANGLFNDYYKQNADKVWCICFIDNSEKITVFVNDERLSECTYQGAKPLSQCKAWLAKQASHYKALICHNQIHYDLRMLKKFLGVDYTIKPDTICGEKIEIIDSLLDSKWLNPKRMLPWGCPGSIKPKDGGKSKIVGPHGLEAWGYRTSKKKPAIEDWEGLHIDEYVNRCVEDIKINLDTFKLLNTEIAVYFKGIDDIAQWKANREKASLPIFIEHKFKQDITEQEENGVPFNIELAKSYLPILDKELDELRTHIESHLPNIPIPPSRLKDWKFPAKPFNNDGSPSKNFDNWVAKFNGKHWKDEQGKWNCEIEVEGKKKQYKAPFPEYIKTTEQMTVRSEHLAQYIIDTYGWKPMYWNYQIDPKTKKKMRDENKKLIPTTPRFKEAQSGRLCPHLESLEVPFVKDVIRYRTLEHRRNTIESSNNEEKGYLNHPRLHIDGRLPASMDTIGAATSRCTHSVVCNVPKADDEVIFGKELRSLFWHGGDQDWYFIGWDASQLENRLEGSETAKYDGGEYANILINSDIHQVRAELFGIKRSHAKNVAYALLFGAGVGKIAEMLNMPLQQAKDLLEDWWQQYWASKKVIDRLQNEHKKNGSKFITGIDGRPIQFTSPHLCMNYRIQNAGTVTMKLHTCLMSNDEQVKKWKKDGLVFKVLDIHDETQWLVHKSLVRFKKVADKEEGMKWFKEKNTTKPFEKDGQWWVGYCKLGVLGCNYITKAGERLGLRVKLEGDYQLGRSWGDTH